MARKEVAMSTSSINVEPVVKQSEAKKTEQVVCFVCRKRVPLAETIELDHSNGRLKLRVCHKHVVY